MQALMTMFLLLSSFIYTPTIKSDIDVLYNEIYEIETDYYTIKNERVSFYYNSFYILSLTGDDLNYSCFEYNSNLYIAYNDSNKIKLLAYSDANKKVLDKTYSITDDVYAYGNIKIDIANDYIYIYSSNYKDDNYDVMCLKLDLKGNIIDLNLLGGEKNDYFIDYKKIDNKYYMLVKHDELSIDSDFGNHGKYVLAIIEDNKVIKYVSFKDEELSDFTYSLYDNEYLINICFNNKLYVFDADLNQKIGLEFGSESIFISESFSNLTLIIDANELKIYEDYNYKLLKSISLEMIDDEMVLDDVKVIDANIYLYFTDGIKSKIYSLEIFDFRGYVTYVNYLDGLSEYNEYAYTWNKTIKANKDLSNFSSSVNGEYKINVSYDGDYNTVTKEMIVNVNSEVNVIDGMIYPMNYHLLFTGTAFLNGKMINNNYALSDEGDYKLELYDNNKNKTTYYFSVSLNQIDFSNDTYKVADYSLVKGESIDIKYHLELGENDKISKVIVDGKEYKSYKYNDSMLTIRLNGSSLGFNEHSIDYIMVLHNDELIEYEINDKVCINVFEKLNDISCEYTINKDDIQLDFYNDDNSIRLINIYLDDTFYKSYELGDNEIVINVKDEYQEVKFMLAYEIGDSKYYEKELTRFVTQKNNYSLGSINIVKKEDSLSCFSIDLNKDAIDVLYIEDDVIYEHETNSNKKYYLIIIPIVLTTGFALYFVFKHKKKQSYLLIK